MKIPSDLEVEEVEAPAGGLVGNPGRGDGGGGGAEAVASERERERGWNGVGVREASFRQQGPFPSIGCHMEDRPAQPAWMWEPARWHCFTRWEVT